MLVLVVLMVLMVLMVSVVMLQVELEVSLYWVLSVLTGISDMSFM